MLYTDSMKLTKLFLITLPIMFVIDFSWAAFIAKDFYSSQLGALISSHPVVPAILAFYVLYSFAIAYFVLAPALAVRSYKLLAMNATLLGLTAYGTYDLVNLGITPGWPVLVTVVDMIWGMAVTLIVSSAVYFLTTHRLKPQRV